MMNLNYEVDIHAEIEHHRLQWRADRERAKEIVRDRGWTEKDDDFEIQIELEAKQQWEEEYDREFFKRDVWELEREAMGKAASSSPEKASSTGDTSSGV